MIDPFASSGATRGGARPAPAGLDFSPAGLAGLVDREDGRGYFPPVAQQIYQCVLRAFGMRGSILVFVDMLYRCT